MIAEIKQAIDDKIKELKPIEENLWIIYDECKKVITDDYTKFLPPDEYNEYIKYITDTLQI